MQWLGKVEKLLDQKKLAEWQRWLHQHAERSFEETETAGYIRGVLSTFDNLEITRPTPTSVIAALKGARPGPVIGLRADIDALPLEEQADTEHKSINKGMMHACGHDSHAAMLLGAAHVLSQMKGSLHGGVKFIFQHAEEYPPGGAKEIMDTGLLDDVCCFYANHVSPNEPVGAVGSDSGPRTAAVDSIFLNVTGKGGHGAMPHLTIDPIVVGCEIVSNLNNIVARNVSPLNNVVISMGKFTSGTVNNIIPQTAELHATVRTTTPETRGFIEGRVRSVIDGICKAYGAEYALSYVKGYAPVINDERCVAIVRKVAAYVLGEGGCKATEKSLGGEDFSAYLDKAPGALVEIFSGSGDGNYNYSLHHPKFIVNPGALPIGAKMYIGYALESLQAFEWS